MNNGNGSSPAPALPPKGSSPLPEVDTSLFNPSFQLESPQQESPFNVAVLLASSPAHDPSLSTHHHSVGPLEDLSPHDIGPMDPFPDAMDWLTPAASDVDAAYRRHRRLVSMTAHLRSWGTTLPSSPLQGVRVGRLRRRQVSER